MAAGLLGRRAVLAAVTVASKAVLRGRGVVITVGGVVFFVVIVCFCYSQSFVLSECLGFFEGFSAILMISSFNISIQHLSSDEMRGRVMSIYATCFLGLPPVGALMAGELSRHIPTSHALALMAGTAGLIFLGTFALSRSLRELD
jgi:hypothetical protein